MDCADGPGFVASWRNYALQGRRTRTDHHFNEIDRAVDLSRLQGGAHSPGT